MSRFMCLIYYLRGMALNCGDKFLVRSGQGAVLVVVQDNLLRSGVTIFLIISRIRVKESPGVFDPLFGPFTK